MRLNLFIPLISAILLLFSCKENTRTLESEVADTDSNSPYYHETHRPQFHFSPETSWMNDPNGMVYFEGEYHLFYQYYPDSTVWGPMHWGHAVSPDMLHWEHLPIALYPDSLGYIFSGSAVIDWNNTSGLGKEGQAPMIAIFTHHDMGGEKRGTNTFQYQSIAYSHDKGRSWTKYEGNPVVPNPGIKDFRDPKVIWHEDSKQWVMVFAAYDKVRIYNSPDLKSWTFASEFGIPGDKRLWECPDLFQLAVEGTNEKKWVLITSIQKEGPNEGTATSYFVGDFDGKTFKGDFKKQYWADYGKDNYAMVSWSDVPQEDGRRLALGWMSNWQYAQIVPTEKWRSAMTLPRELTLHKVRNEYKMFSLPVKELNSLEGKRTKIEAQTIEGSKVIADFSKQALYKLALTFERPQSKNFVVRFSNEKGEYVDVGYAPTEQAYFIDRTNSGKTDFSEHFPGRHRGEITLNKDIIDWTLYLDHSSIELFADGGSCVMTDIMFPQEPFSKIELLSEGHEVSLLSGELVELNSIWSRNNALVNIP